MEYYSYVTGQYNSGDEQQSHMATAATTEAGELVYADRVDPSARPFYCIGCAESHEVSYVKSHLRELGDDSTTVSPHFRHPSSTGRSGSAGGPAESDTHRRRKIEALGVAMIRYDYAEADLETPINGKRPDGYLEFEFPDERFGRGFAIEYQHRNESKDIKASADAFAAEEFTTLVLTAEQFPDDMTGVPNIDLLGGRVITPFPRGLPDDVHEFETSWATKATRVAESDWTGQVEEDSDDLPLTARFYLESWLAQNNEAILKRSCGAAYDTGKLHVSSDTTLLVDLDDRAYWAVKDPVNYTRIVPTTDSENEAVLWPKKMDEEDDVDLDKFADHPLKHTWGENADKSETQDNSNSDKEVKTTIYHPLTECPRCGSGIDPTGRPEDLRCEQCDDWFRLIGDLESKLSQFSNDMIAIHAESHPEGCYCDICLF
jgi:hypothetical protein